MKLRFDESKTTALAAEFLRLAGGRMPYLKLIKLLYLADRRALDLHGSPVTGDHYVSMKLGPVLSKTYDMIKSPPEPGLGRPGELWNSHIVRDGYDVELRSKPKDTLCDADMELAGEVYQEFGHHSEWTMAELTHEFPEWRNPGESSIPIDYEDIVAALGKQREEANEILARLRMKAYLQDVAALG